MSEAVHRFRKLSNKESEQSAFNQSFWGDCLQSGEALPGESQACHPAPDASTALLPDLLHRAADMAPKGHAYFQTQCSGLSDYSISHGPEQDTQRLNNESCHLSDLPAPQEIEDLLLGDLPIADLDLDSMMDELESMQPGAAELCPLKVARSQSHSSDQVFSMDSLHSADSLQHLHFRDGSPEASSSQLEQQARPSCSSDTLLRNPPLESATSKRKKSWEEDHSGQTAKRMQAKPSKKASSRGKRPRGRPRLYDTSIPETGKESAAEAETDEKPNPERKKRGAKPKYKFATEAEAVAMRRERNRNTAISSYYKKKEREEQLLAEIEGLEKEKEALTKLDSLAGKGTVDLGLLGAILRESGSGLHAMQQLCLGV